MEKKMSYLDLFRLEWAESSMIKGIIMADAINNARYWGVDFENYSELLKIKLREFQNEGLASSLTVHTHIGRCTVQVPLYAAYVGEGDHPHLHRLKGVLVELPRITGSDQDLPLTVTYTAYRRAEEFLPWKISGAID